VKKYKHIDTNILLLDSQNLKILAEVDNSEDDITLVISETVIDELDSKKSLLSELGYNAREFGRTISKAEVISTNDYGSFSVVKINLNGISIEIVSKKEYKLCNSESGSISNDLKILEIVQVYSDTFLGQQIFISNDVMARIRATSLGLETTSLIEVDNVDLDFSKELKVSSDIFSKIRNNSNLTIYDIDKDYCTRNYNYTITCEETNQQKLISVLPEGKIDYISKEKETDLRRQEASPINKGQLFFSNAIQSQLYDIIICESLSGSGKTVSALSNAMKLIKAKKYECIYYIRNSVDDVDKAEQQGFRKGGDSEKNGIFFLPLDDTLDFIARKKHSNSKLKANELEEKINAEKEDMMKKYNIIPLTALGLRGRTLRPNSIIIFEEIQNASSSSFQKMLTRVGKNSMIICIGSQNQIDNPYLTKYNNGLSILLDSCTKKMETDINLYGVTLHKVARSSVSEFAEKLFTNKLQLKEG